MCCNLHSGRYHVTLQLQSILFWSNFDVTLNSNELHREYSHDQLSVQHSTETRYYEYSNCELLSTTLFSFHGKANHTELSTQDDSLSWNAEDLTSHYNSCPINYIALDQVICSGENNCKNKCWPVWESQIKLLGWFWNFQLSWLGERSKTGCGRVGNGNSVIDCKHRRNVRRK